MPFLPTVELRLFIRFESQIKSQSKLLNNRLKSDPVKVSGSSGFGVYQRIDGLGNEKRRRSGLREDHARQRTFHFDRKTGKKLHSCKCQSHM